MALSTTRVQISVGGFVIIVFGLLAAWAAGGGARSTLFTPTIRLECYLPQNLGFGGNTKVTYLGMEIGRVTDIGFATGAMAEKTPIWLEFRITERHAALISDNFVVTYESDPFGGILSNKLILSPPAEEAPSGRPVQDGDRVVYQESKAIMDQIQELALQVAADTLPLVQTIGVAVEDSIAGVAGLIYELSDPTGDLQTTIRGIRRLIDNMNDPQGPILGTMASIGRITHTLESEDGLVATVLRNPEVAKTVTEMLANVDKILADAATISKDVAEKSPSMTTSGQETLKLVNELLDGIKPLREQLQGLLTQTEKTLEPFAAQSTRIEQLLILAKRDAEHAQDILAALKKHWLLRDYVTPKADLPATVRRPMLDDGEDLK